MSKVTAKGKGEKYLLFSTSLMSIIKQIPIVDSSCKGADGLLSEIDFDFLHPRDLDCEVRIIKDDEMVTKFSLKTQDDTLSTYLEGKKCKYPVYDSEVLDTKLEELRGLLGVQATVGDLSKYALVYYAYKTFRCIPSKASCRSVDIDGETVTVWLKRKGRSNDFDRLMIVSGNKSYIVTFDDPPLHLKRKFESYGGMIEISMFRPVKKNSPTTVIVDDDLGLDCSNLYDLEHKSSRYS